MQRKSIFGAVPLVSGLGLLSAVLGATTGTSIPYAPHGDASGGTVAVIVPLTPDSYLAAAEGQDGAFSTTDDLILLVTGVRTTPVVTPLAAPNLPSGSGSIVRLSATRALAISEGTDGTFGTADDAVLLLDQLGSANQVTAITVGAIVGNEAFIPARLTASSAVMVTRGADLAMGTADDTIAWLAGLGGTSTVSYLPAPRLREFRSRPAVLSPQAFLLPSDGPDGAPTTVDDQVFLFSGLGSTHARTDLTVPYQAAFSPRTPVRVSATRAVMAGAGPDQVEATADDQLFVLDRLGSGNTITPIALPHRQDFGAGIAAILSPTTLTIATEGPDSTRETADDTLAVITGLGTTNTVTMVTVGGLDEDPSSRGTRLAHDRVAFSTGGTPNPLLGGGDDQVVIVSDVGGTNLVSRVNTPGVSGIAGSQVLPLSRTSLLVSHGGPDGNMGHGGDDLISLVTGIGGNPMTESVAASVELDPSDSSAPRWLGSGRAVVVSTGANGTMGTGNDDVMRVVSGLPEVRGITVERLTAIFKRNQPNAPETLSVSGGYANDDPTLLDGQDLTISIGNAAQTIRGALLKRSRTGVLTYKDPRRRNGFITALTIDPVKHRFSITGRGQTGVRTTGSGYVPVGIDANLIYLSNLVAARSVRTGFRFP
jgi:hypothetical protein